MQDLTFDMYTAMDCGEKRHALIVMKELGITYLHATPQSMMDCWWFWNCENIPDTLPEYLSITNRDLFKCIGRGISEEDAKKIAEYRKDNEK